MTTAGTAGAHQREWKSGAWLRSSCNAPNSTIQPPMPCRQVRRQVHRPSALPFDSSSCDSSRGLGRCLHVFSQLPPNTPHHTAATSPCYCASRTHLLAVLAVAVLADHALEALPCGYAVGDAQPHHQSVLHRCHQQLAAVGACIVQRMGWEGTGRG